MAHWEELPQDILQLIAPRLAIVDFLALRGVCTSWRSAAVKNMYSATSKAPWFMISKRRQVEFLSPFGVKFYRLQLSARRPMLSSPGWILVPNWVSGYRIFNPISRVHIKLPTLDLEKMRCRPTKIDRIALFSSPSLSRNYTVMVSLEPLGFALYRSGEDAWTVVSPSTFLPREKVRGLVHYDGLFVALDACNSITILDERERCMRLRMFLGKNFDGHPCPYLVECSGSLLVAWKIGGVGYGTGCSFRVFKVDLQKGTEEEVQSLGNASLFLNANSSFSVEFKAETCLPEIKPNCIYFPQYTNSEMYVYSMEQGKVERCPNSLDRDDFSLQWFQPEF